MKDADYYIAARDWEPVTRLPEAWGRWQDGWRFFKRIDLKNATSLARPSEPIEVEAEFHAGEVKVERVLEPAWEPDQMTHRARRILALNPTDDE